MKVVISHPTGNAFVRAACHGLLNANVLLEFNTALASFPGDVFDLINVNSISKEIKRRRFDKSLQQYTHIWPWRELGRLLASRGGFSTLFRHEYGPFSVDAVYRSCDQHVAARLPHAMKHGAQTIYAYEDGAYFSFKESKKLGISCFYDLPIGYWRAARRFLDVERDRWPEWASTIVGFNDSNEKLERKDEELRLSDRIIVASQFTAKTLQSFPHPLSPINVVPYGFPPVYANKEYSKLDRKPLKLLFVGSLSQRKGIANLFAAVNSFGSYVKLTVVGRKASDNCIALDNALSKHHWIPTLSHDKILQIMREHDVLVFPSLFEGFGLVITEAMSQGTPVITTDRTAGPDLMKHDENGWLIEAGSTQALIEMIEKLLDQPERIIYAGRAAQETARNRPWNVYGSELASAIISEKQA